MCPENSTNMSLEYAQSLNYVIQICILEVN